MSTALPNSQTVRRIRPASPAQRPLVLIAEDHEDTRSMLKTLLAINGYDFTEAADGEEAVRLAKEFRPDLILMDGGLPRLDGFAATRRIRQSGPCDRVPIIFLSGHAEPSFIGRAREAGCDEYIVKPIDLDELDSVMKRYLQKKQHAVAN